MGASAVSEVCRWFEFEIFIFCLKRITLSFTYRHDFHLLLLFWLLTKTLFIHTNKADVLCHVKCRQARVITCQEK